MLRAQKLMETCIISHSQSAGDVEMMTSQQNGIIDDHQSMSCLLNKQVGLAVFRFVVAWHALWHAYTSVHMHVLIIDTWVPAFAYYLEFTHLLNHLLKSS